MNDLSSTIGLVARQVRDMQSVVSRMDRHMSRLIDEPVQRGAQLVALTASRLARQIGNEAAADRLEAKALASPAMTTVATWAAELSSAGLPSFILSLERRTALAGILARSPQVSLLKVGTTPRSGCRRGTARDHRGSKAMQSRSRKAISRAVVVAVQVGEHPALHRGAAKRRQTSKR